MDSPAYCTKYCTYSFMEHNSNEVIHAEVVDKRETGDNSNAMETKGFDRGLIFHTQQDGITLRSPADNFLCTHMMNMRYDP